MTAKRRGGSRWALALVIMVTVAAAHQGAASKGSPLKSIAKPSGFLTIGATVFAEIDKGAWKPADHKTSAGLRNLSLQCVGIGSVSGTITAQSVYAVPGRRLTVLQGVRPNYDGVATFGLRPTVPKPVPLSQVALQEAIRQTEGLLRSKGVRLRALHVRASLCADLDGDGAAETLVAASSQRSHEDFLNAELTDSEFSVVVLTSARGGKSGQSVLEFWSGKEKVEAEALLVAVADFDGDGAHEIVTTKRETDGEEVSVWRLRRGSLSKLVKFGAGYE